METMEVKLFVCGDAPKYRKARLTLEEICKTRLKDRCSLEIIDVLEKPWEAEDYKVMVTPTILKLRPLPIKRVIGDVIDSDEFMMALELESEK